MDVPSSSKTEKGNCFGGEAWEEMGMAAPQTSRTTLSATKTKGCSLQRTEVENVLSRETLPAQRQQK